MMEILIGVVTACMVLMSFFMISALASEREKNKAIAKLAEAERRFLEDEEILEVADEPVQAEDAVV